MDWLVLQIKRADLKVKIKVLSDFPHVLADPPRIQQVMMNLVHNAIKFTPPGGKITVTGALGSIKEVDSVIFCVADNGVGISADTLPRVFERFYKSDRARSGGGTGLGLAIAKHLVEAHRGEIWAESSEGDGSRFFFSLPIAHRFS